VPALPHPHLPRAVVLALAAILLALVLVLHAATQVGDIGLGSSTGPAATGATVERPAAHATAPVSPARAVNLFAAPFRVRLPWPVPKM